MAFLGAPESCLIVEWELEHSDYRSMEGETKGEEMIRLGVELAVAAFLVAGFATAFVSLFR